jgi:hypothetical protein
MQSSRKRKPAEELTLFSVSNLYHSYSDYNSENTRLTLLTFIKLTTKYYNLPVFI